MTKPIAIQSAHRLALRAIDMACVPEADSWWMQSGSIAALGEIRSICAGVRALLCYC